MQTFSDMSRNSTTKNILVNIAILVTFVCYLALSNIYVFLPPLLGLLFTKYIKDFKDANFFGSFVVLILCIFFELEKSNNIGFLFLLFIFLSFVVSKIGLILQEESRFFGVIYVFLPYMFYFFVLQSLTIFNHQMPIVFTPIILWYVFCESVLVIWKR